MPSVQLTPGQMIKVYGLFPQSNLLTWGDITKLQLTFDYLTNTLHIPADKLHLIQPDVEAWVQAGLVGLLQCKSMKAWPLNPIRDLSLSADKLIGFPSNELMAFGVTFSQLLQNGLHPGLMQMFHFTLSEWTHLGMKPEHIYMMTDAQCMLLFGMTARQCVADVKALKAS